MSNIYFIFRSNLIPFFQLRLGLSSRLFPSGVPTRVLCTSLYSPFMLHVPSISSSSQLITLNIFARRTYHKASPASVYIYRSILHTIISHPTETTQQFHYNDQLIKCCREATFVDCHNHATQGATSVIWRNVTLRRHALGCSGNKSVRHVTVLIYTLDWEKEIHPLLPVIINVLCLGYLLLSCEALNWHLGYSCFHNRPQHQLS